MPEKFLIKFDTETGERVSTIPYDNDITPEKANEMINQGYEIVSLEDWNLLVGNVDGEVYIKDLVHGGYVKKPPRVITLQEAQDNKIAELKKIRDEKELEPIAVRINEQTYEFDFDEKAYSRIQAAIIALDQGGTIYWTCADSVTVVGVTANVLRGVVSAAAVRSNSLHIYYRQLKEQVLASTSNAEVEAITWAE